MKIIHLCIWLTLFSSAALANSSAVRNFPIQQYSQNINTWIQQSHIDPDKDLMTSEASQQHLQQYYDKNYGHRSPWDPDFVQHMLLVDSVSAAQVNQIEFYLRHNKQCIGEHSAQVSCFLTKNHELPKDNWYKKLTDNLNVSSMLLHYRANSRGILVNNAELRRLPTTETLYEGYQAIDEKYPFDELAVGVEWIGTPVYILNTSKDKQWLLVLTPNATAWVQADAVARVSNNYLKHYRQAIKHAPIALVQNNLRLESQQQQYLATGFVGTVLPQAEKPNQVLLPRTDAQGMATNAVVNLVASSGVKMPLKATPRNIAQMITTELGRPYSGGNLDLYHDSSQALKVLFVPFGVWLPRESNNQVEAAAHIDLSSKNEEQRLTYLRKHGVAFKTLINVNGHVMLYLGIDPTNNQVMTFQNPWALKPGDSSYHAVIGKAVLLPLLTTYPNDPKLLSQANLARFKIRTL